MTIANYIGNIHRRYKQGNATGHTFRGDLENSLVKPAIEMVNHELKVAMAQQQLRKAKMTNSMAGVSTRQ